MMTRKLIQTTMVAVVSLGLSVAPAFADSSIADIVDGMSLTISDKTTIEANVGAILEAPGNEPLFRGTDQLSPTMLATPLYGTDRLIYVPIYGAIVNVRLDLVRNQVDWNDFQNVELNTPILWGTDRI